jgi:hypothetical protein
VWQRIEAARAARGTKIVVIDPRRTETAEQADLHVAVAPDGDVALFNALLAEMRARGLAGAGIAETPEGFWDALGTDPGVPADQFAALADLVAAFRAWSRCSARAPTSRSAAPTRAMRSSTCIWPWGGSTRRAWGLSA